MPQTRRRRAGGEDHGGDEQARVLIGRAIKVRREKAQMTLPEAAEALGITRETLTRWEKGEGSLWTGGDAGCVDHTMMAKLKAVYNAEISELMPRNQYPSAPVDPALRRDWVWRRNAAIQGVEDIEAYVQTQRDQRDRTHGRPSNLR
jgi:transcriptional regulator with XRE-family HTH domain